MAVLCSLTYLCSCVKAAAQQCLTSTILLPTPRARTMSAYMQQVGVKLFRQHLENYAPPDPVYEYYSDAKGKQRRKKVSMAFSPGCDQSSIRIVSRLRYTTKKISPADSFLLYFFYSVTLLLGSPHAMLKSSRLSNAEHVASIRASTFVVSVSGGRSSSE